VETSIGKKRAYNFSRGKTDKNLIAPLFALYLNSSNYQAYPDIKKALTT
jgi:hypothetical protein